MMLYIGIFAVIVVACVFISLMMMKKQKLILKEHCHWLKQKPKDE